MKKLFSLLLAVSLCLTVTACNRAGSTRKQKNEKLVIGFAQIGQESGWRDAETSDIQWYAARHTDTIELQFSFLSRQP